MQQLEEAGSRSLNGRIEEMSYQLLQMQETDAQGSRKTMNSVSRISRRRAVREEERRAGQAMAGRIRCRRDAITETQAVGAGADVSRRPADDIAGTDPGEPSTGAADQSAATDSGMPATGELGSIQMDANGNGSTALPGDDTRPMALSKGSNGAGGTATDRMRLSGADSDSLPDCLWACAVRRLFSQAEQRIPGRIIAAVPEQGKKIADANFWLGEAYLFAGQV